MSNLFRHFYIRLKLFTYVNELTKRCSNCDNLQSYKTEVSLKRAVNKNTLCKKCRGNNGNRSNVTGLYFADYDVDVRHRMEQAKKDHEGKDLFSKNCPTCNHLVMFKSLACLVDSVRLNRECQSCATKETRPSFKGKKHSDETLLKMRESALRRVKANSKGCISYNKLACAVFDKLNKTFEWNGQHALNKGEKELFGYSIDYYYEVPDTSLKIIIEWDEPYHLTNECTAKDIKKQKYIESMLGEDCIFLRWDQRKNDWREIVPLVGEGA
jgi:hypothetical protein